LRWGGNNLFLEELFLPGSEYGDAAAAFGPAWHLVAGVRCRSIRCGLRCGVGFVGYLAFDRGSGLGARVHRDSGTVHGVGLLARGVRGVVGAKGPFDPFRRVPSGGATQGSRAVTVSVTGRAPESLAGGSCSGRRRLASA